MRQAMTLRAATAAVIALSLLITGLLGGPIKSSAFQSSPPTVGPQVSFYWTPDYPSTFDTVQFYDTSWDPAYQGFQSFTWDFGDGGTATGPQPTHKYAQDGDYTVLHTATTFDERTGSASRVVQVQTHDVAIIKLSAPNSAAVNQTKQVVAYVASNRQSEIVSVALWRSGPYHYGLGMVGQYTQLVPVRPPGGKATEFTFNYTFTPQDLAMGKVTFKVEASIANARDALPADNEMVSLPTKITR